MAACNKCGSVLKRRKDGRRKCKHCGFAPNNKNLDRNGLRGGGSMLEQDTDKVQMLVQIQPSPPSGSIAQGLEHVTHNDMVGGSNPLAPTMFLVDSVDAECRVSDTKVPCVTTLRSC